LLQTLVLTTSTDDIISLTTESILKFNGQCTVHCWQIWPWFQIQSLIRLMQNTYSILFY